VEIDLYMAEIEPYNDIRGFVWIGVFGLSLTKNQICPLLFEIAIHNFIAYIFLVCYDILTIMCNNLDLYICFIGHNNIYCRCIHREKVLQKHFFQILNSSVQIFLNFPIQWLKRPHRSPSSMKLISFIYYTAHHLKKSLQLKK
jgi:hypothetical protein